MEGFALWGVWASVHPTVKYTHGKPVQDNPESLFVFVVEVYVAEAYSIKWGFEWLEVWRDIRLISNVVHVDVTLEDTFKL